MGTLSKIYHARKKILEGVKNIAIRDEFVEIVHEHRINICKGCAKYDGKCAIPGTGPCCGACGCSLAIKTRSLDSACGMIEIGKDPLWLPVVNKHLAEELENLKK